MQKFKNNQFQINMMMLFISSCILVIWMVLEIGICGMTSKKSVNDVIKQLVLAHADGEIKSLIVVFVNRDNEPEAEIAIGPYDFYQLNTMMDLIKFRMLEKMANEGMKKPKDRE